jgi:hypothetical protein
MSKRPTTVVNKRVDKNAPEPLSMIGRCFIIWGEDQEWNFQGIIRGEPMPGVYLCQFFDALIGAPSDLTIIPLDQMTIRPWAEPGSFKLFEDDEQLRFWIEHRSPKGRHKSTRSAGASSTP